MTATSTPGTHQNLVIVYRRNLKMSPGMLAAQVAQAVLLSGAKAGIEIIVLAASDKKFNRTVNNHRHGYLIKDDDGYTEVPKDTVTCFAHFAPLSPKQHRRRWIKAVNTAWTNSSSNPFEQPSAAGHATR